MVIYVSSLSSFFFITGVRTEKVQGKGPQGEHVTGAKLKAERRGRKGLGGVPWTPCRRGQGQEAIGMH